MAYTLEQIKSDLLSLDVRQFYLKYIVRSDNWYFENVLGFQQEQLIKLSDDFRLIISESLGISFNNVLIVGSSKTGYSFSPGEKRFAPFCVNGTDRPISDIDIAIISPDLYHKFWKLFRQNYTLQNKAKYPKIYTEIYRGFINEKRIISIEGCRKEWTDISTKSKKRIAETFFVQHKINYRIYRSWEDFEEYNLSGIQKLKGELLEETHGTV